MGLKTYRKKRDFTRTPEPVGRVHSEAGRRLYVIQKHAATRLHYDLRLEEGGVLKSWAVPKGPSLDPTEKRLAVQVEDHPLEYGEFEGVIPEGEYGGGKVQLWDRGHWVPEGDAAAGLRKGKLKFHLEGKKLHGAWNLVRMHGQAGQNGKVNWLLIKETDDVAAPQHQRDIVQERPESILSGRHIEDIEAHDDSVWHSNRSGAPTSSHPRDIDIDPSKIEGARKTRVPEIKPFQLATLTDRPPVGDEWLNEIKLDGFRMQCRIDKGKARLLTRTGQDWTHRFPGVAQAAAHLPVQTALLDGELVALQADGRSSFQLLQGALSEGAEATVAYYAFDLLYLNGYDLSAAALERRKDVLKRLLEAISGDSAVRYSDHVVGGAPAFYEAACRLGLEGMIAKRRAAPYRSGRGGDWLKVKCLLRQEFVIGGYTDPSGSRTGFGALLLGVYDNHRLVYAGRVGTGFNTGLLKALGARLKRLAQTETPFHTRVPGPLRDVHWVRPELVAEIAFTEWTSDGVLRHPSFQGLREDKPPTDVKREIAQPPPMPGKSPPATANRTPAHRRQEEVEIAGIRLTHPSRVLYPEQGVTKLDLAHYYHTIADLILPHITGRPVMLLRCPEGQGKACFHQKHKNPMVPDEVHAVEIKEDNGKTSHYLMVEDLPGLIALVQMGALELHVWGSRRERLEYPDRMVFDLDPDEGLPWPRVIEAAELIRSRLTDAGLQSWVKTTGGKGLHVVVPLAAKQTWDEVKVFSQALAEDLVKEAPERYTSKMTKAGRKGKIFIDYLRNSRGATAVAAYSTRARPGATVSMPVGWDELRRLKLDEVTVKTVPHRLKTLKQDPWKEFWTVRQSITQSARRAVGLK